MRRPMCGTPSEADAFFCGNCGTSLRAAPTPSDAASWNNANPYVAPTPSDAASWNNANSYAASGALNVGPSFAGAFGYCFAKFCSFKGRATRMEFWGWTVFATLIAVVLDFISHFAIGRAIATTDYEATERAIWIIFVAEFALNAILRLPTLSVGVRRAHDFGMPMAPVLLYHAISFGFGLTTLLQFAVILQTYWVVDQESPLCWLGFALYWLGIVLTLLLGTISGSRGANRYGEKRYNPGSAPSPWENGVAAPNWNAPNAAAPNWNAPNAAAPGWNAPNAASMAMSAVPTAGNATSCDGDVTVGPSYRGAFWYCMKNYCNFKGRATRTEYWGWNAICWGILLGLILFSEDVGLRGDAAVLFIGVVGAAFTAIFLTPSLAVVARRAHDLGTSAIPFCLFGAVCWARFLAVALAISELTSSNFESFVKDAWQWRVLHWLGLVVLLVLGLIPGSKGANRFGKKRCNPSDILGLNDDAQNAKE